MRESAGASRTGETSTDGPIARGSGIGVRVLFVQTQVENAGAQEISRLVGAGLAARGHVVHHLFFYSRTSGPGDLDSVETCAPERPDGLVATLRLICAARRRIARFAPDVILTFQHWGNALGAPIARSVTRAPIIANQVSPPELVGFAARELDRLWGVLGLYRTITTNSEATQTYFQRYAEAYRRRLVPVPYGCESKSSDLDRAGARRALGLPVDAPVLGCAARLHPSKRLDAAIATLPHLPGHHLAIAGQGAAEGMLRAIAAGLGVADRVHFLGELKPSDIGTFLAALDVFVFPSAVETFGLAVLEAAVAGVPVVASQLPVLREVLVHDGEAAALFVDVENPKVFAEAIARVLTDGALAAKLAAAGTALRRRHSLSGMIDAYAALIEDTTREGAPR